MSRLSSRVVKLNGIANFHTDEACYETSLHVTHVSSSPAPYNVRQNVTPPKVTSLRLRCKASQEFELWGPWVHRDDYCGSLDMIVVVP